MRQVDPRLQAALALLGLGTDADLEQVKRAYRRLARGTHPDVCATSDAAARFDALTRAHRLVADATRPPRDRESVTPASPASRPDDVTSWSEASHQRVTPPDEADPVDVADNGDLLRPLSRATLGTWGDNDVWIVAGPVHIDPHRRQR